jgi:hypothetical protein
MGMKATFVINVPTVMTRKLAQSANSGQTVITGKNPRIELLAVNATIVLSAPILVSVEIPIIVTLGGFQLNAKSPMTGHFVICPRSSIIATGLKFVMAATILTIPPTVQIRTIANGATTDTGGKFQHFHTFFTELTTVTLRKLATIETFVAVGTNHPPRFFGTIVTKPPVNTIIRFGLATIVTSAPIGKMRTIDTDGALIAQMVSDDDTTGIFGMIVKHLTIGTLDIPSPGVARHGHIIIHR